MLKFIILAENSYMADEWAEIVKRLDETDKKIEEISKQWVILRHEYRSTRDKALKLEIKKKWDELQKKRQQQHRLKWAVKVVGLPVLLQSLSILYLKKYLNKFGYKLQHKKVLTLLVLHIICGHLLKIKVTLYSLYLFKYYVQNIINYW